MAEHNSTSSFLIRVSLHTAHRFIRRLLDFRSERLLHPVRSLKHLMWYISRYKSIAAVTNSRPEEVKRYINEFLAKRELHEHIKNGYDYMRSLGLKTWRIDELLTEILYIIVRIVKPLNVVETGVSRGVSSSYILQALEDNGKGELHSIDLPKLSEKGQLKPEEEQIADSLPEKRESGWIIPQKLRKRWHLILGRSSDKLVPLLKKLGQVDIFLHDNLHTYDNMLWEYKTVWPFLRKGGVLLSHDVSENNAFPDFCGSVGRRCVYITANFGAVRK